MISHCKNKWPGKLASTSFRLLMLAGWLVITQLAHGQEQDPDESDDKIGVFAGVGDIVDRSHGRVSDGFSSFIVQIDDFFAAEESPETQNKSWARLRLDAIKPGADDPKVSGTVKLRLVLPRAQQRFRLLLSSEDEDISASETDAAQREQIAADDNNDVSLALRFIRSARRSGSINFDLGARVREDKAQVFGRINMSYGRDMAFGFTGRIRNSFVLYSASGYENKLRIDLRRNLFGRESLFFRTSTEFRWRKGYKGAGIGETVGIYADLGRRKAVALEGISGFTTSLNDEQTRRYLGSELRLRFRHNVWREWFFYEIWPSVSWSESNDYSQAYGGLVRVEVVFGNL